MSTFKFVLVIAVSLVIAAGSMVGVYALAETIAISVARSFTTNAEPKHSRLDTLGAAVKRSATAYQLARNQCLALANTERSECFARARSERLRAANDANLVYQCSLRNSQTNESAHDAAPPANAAQPATENSARAKYETAKSALDIDTALYRTHRQMPL
jgi:hypothetical protein